MGRTTRTVHVSECAQGAASPRTEIAGAKCARTFIVAGRQSIVLVIWPFGGLSLMVVIPAGVAMRFSLPVQLSGEFPVPRDAVTGGRKE